MSSIAARHMMRHRCDYRTDQNRGQTDEAGNDLAPDWVMTTGVPCYLHADFRSGFSGEFNVGDRFNVARSLYRLMVPRDSGIDNADEIVEVRNQRGDAIYSGNLKIENFEYAEYYTVFYLTERQ